MIFGIQKLTLGLQATILLGCSALAQPLLPFAGGPTLTETFENWQVICGIQAGARRCLASHHELDPNRQRLLAIELMVVNGNTLRGTIALPAGLRRDAGITLHVDETPVGKPLSIDACGATGCMAVFQFDGRTTDMLRMGTTLKLVASHEKNDTPVAFSLGLTGFAAAISRVMTLSK